MEGTTAQFGGASGDVFSAICSMQIPRFTASKPSKFAFASDEKIHSPADCLIVRCYPKSTLDKSHSKRGFVKPSPWQGRTYSPPASRRWYPSRWSGSCTLRWGVSLSAESDRKFGKPHSLHEKRRCWQKYSSGIFRDDAALPIALRRILYAVFYRLTAP